MAGAGSNASDGRVQRQLDGLWSAQALAAAVAESAEFPHAPGEEIVAKFGESERMVVAGRDVADVVVLECLDEAGQGAGRWLLRIAVSEGLSSAELTVLIRAHRINMARLTEQQGMVRAAADFRDHGIEAAYLRQKVFIDPVLNCSIRPFIFLFIDDSKAKLAASVVSPDVDLIVRDLTAEFLLLMLVLVFFDIARVRGAALALMAWWSLLLLLMNVLHLRLLLSVMHSLIFCILASVGHLIKYSWRVLPRHSAAAAILALSQVIVRSSGRIRVEWRADSVHRGIWSDAAAPLGRRWQET